MIRSRLVYQMYFPLTVFSAYSVFMGHSPIITSQGTSVLFLLCVLSALKLFSKICSYVFSSTVSVSLCGVPVSQLKSAVAPPQFPLCSLTDS